MIFSDHFTGKEADIAGLFTSTFSASEGSEEGALIGALAGNLMELTPDDDLFVFTAEDETGIVGCIIFSRLSYDGDPRAVFVLGPVAVSTGRQGKGIGQKLLSHGLGVLRDRGVDMAVTYGDPSYYSKVGFAPISQEFAAAPYKLQHPEGWLGQSLTDRELTPLVGQATCVKALDDPAYW
jgi:predicted N-acetyltransferase YhbS